MKINFSQVYEGWKNNLFPSADMKPLIEEVAKDRMEICRHGTIQTGLFGGKEMITKKLIRKNIQEIKNDNTSQLGIECAWERK